jgi:hypothetical protein
MCKFHIYVRNGYVGSVVCTLNALRRAFPWSTVSGMGRVDVYAMG